MECFLELHTESISYLEATRLHEKEQRRKQIGQLQNQLDHLQMVMSTTPIPQEDTIAAMSRRNETQNSTTPNRSNPKGAINLEYASYKLHRNRDKRDRV